MFAMALFILYVDTYFLSGNILLIQILKSLKTIYVEILSVERTCPYRKLLYTDNYFHLMLGFKFS